MDPGFVEGGCEKLRSGLLGTETGREPAASFTASLLWCMQARQAPLQLSATSAGDATAAAADQAAMPASAEAHDLPRPAETLPTTAAPDANESRFRPILLRLAANHLKRPHTP